MATTARAGNGKFIASDNNGLAGNETESIEPNGSGDGAGERIAGINPSDLDARIDAGGYTGGDNDKPKRGRPAGGKNGKAKIQAGSQKKSSPLDISTLDELLFFTHAVAATVLKIPDLNLSRDESASLAKAGSNLARYYEIKTTEKALAWINLGVTVGMVYGTRLIAAGNRKKESKKPVVISPSAPTESGIFAGAFA